MSTATEPAADPSPPPVAEAPSPGEFDRLAVITIQGGGIYGLNLLGQLSHLMEELRVVPVAVAGSSAGAIVAALFWAGYTPREIRDIFARMAQEKKLADLLGPFEPAEEPLDMAHLRQIRGDLKRLARPLLEGAPPSWWGRLWQRAGAIQRFPGRAWAAYRSWRRVTAQFQRRGCFAGGDLTEWIDQLLREGPIFRGRDNLPSRLIEFGDVERLLEKDGTFNPPGLFITATNVTGRRLEVFNSIEPRYRHIPIARAVRASAGFPVVLQPLEFRDRAHAGWYADGGIVSNYPAWVFSRAFRQRLLEMPEYQPVATRAWAHFGLRLERPPAGGDPLDASPSLYLESLIRLLLVGEARSQLEDRLTNAVSRSYIVQQPADRTGLPPAIDLFDVDLVTPEIIHDMYQSGREAATALGPFDYTLPDRSEIEPYLRTLIDQALLVLGQVDSSGKPDNSRVLFRSNVFIPSEDVLSIRYAVNMDDSQRDGDRKLLLRFDTGLSGYSLTSRRPLMCNLEFIGRLPEALLDNLFHMTAQQHRQVRADRTWLASVPIFDPHESYPRNVESSTIPYRGAFFHSLAGRTDGVVLGILNLDAALSYGEFRIDPEPSKHWTDLRIETILNVMMAAAAEVGRRLSPHFARPAITQRTTP